MGNLVIALSWAILVAGILALVVYLFYHSRGGFLYWVRAADQSAMMVLGRQLTFAEAETQLVQTLSDANAALRTLELRSSMTAKVWDEASKTVFAGVVVPTGSIDSAPDGFVIRELHAGRVVRLSGTNQSDETTPIEAVNAALTGGTRISRSDVCIELRGQSFRSYQWAIPADALPEPTRWARIGEWIAQRRDNLWLTVLGTIITLGLLGTRNGAFFAVGVGLIVFLSGACKFVFIHQRTDEADEMHLQNY